MSTFIGLKINKAEKETKKELTVKEIKEILKENGIDFEDKAKKEELIALLPKE
jgi:hypothetical protein